MAFWEGSAILNILFIATLLLVAAGIRRLVAPVRRLAIPDSVTAGTIGLFLGPSFMEVIPFDWDILEVLVYHGLALVFISVGLQKGVKAKSTGGGRSMAIGIPAMAVMQGLVGLAMVLALSYTIYPAGESLHPGFGMLLPLSFSQGPGQALAIGNSWEAAAGIPLGQIGLIMSAIGFAFCCLVGVPIVEYAKYKGWAGDPGREEEDEEERIPQERAACKEAPPGGMETLTLQIAAISACYLVAFGILTTLSDLLASKPKIAVLIWGFHFIVASLVAMAARRLIGPLRIPDRLNDGLLGRIAGLVVDVTTCSALCAIQLPVLQAYWVPIVSITFVGGTLTLILCLWLAKRAFPSAPFEHALVLFGASTGTLPTGLTLLRILDPEMKGPVATSTVLGATGAIVLGAPLLLVLLPIPVQGYPESFPGAVWITLGGCALYLTGLFLLWRYVGPLRYLGPLRKVWPFNPGD